MADPLTLRIRVCSSCGWKNRKVKKALKRLKAEHGNLLELTRKSCLDLCRRDPVVIVGKTPLAPAKPKRLRKVVEERLRESA